MARLRRPVIEDDEGSERRVQRTAPHRSSTASNTQDEARKASARLIPKTTSTTYTQTKKRQVRLGGLQTVPSANSLTSARTAAEDLPKPRRRLGQRQVSKLKDDLQLQLQGWELASGTAGDGLPQIDGEEDAEWCGESIGDSDSSSDGELLSPRMLFAFPRRGNRDIPSDSRPDLSKQLQALRIFDREYAEPAKVNTSASKQSNRSAPPNSSSDKENDAILRYSPPRSRRPKRADELRPSTPPPASPSKAKLQSPSKRPPRILTPPLRPSLDAFWTADAINDWNDEYSPQKPLKSPRKLKLHLDVEECPRSPSKASRKDFEARKISLAESFLHELDRVVTQGQVQELSASTGGVKLIWSKTLNSTAGRAKWRRETTKSSTGTTTHQHFVSIELASKVIDDEHRLLNVLAHEFCHLANFMVSGIKDQPHGKQFKEWGKKCTKAFGDRGVEVTTKHSYEIEYKYIWRCVEEDACGVEFKRHSKSIDPEKHRCGVCKAKLAQIKPVPRKTKQGDAATAPVSGYAAYVKKHFAELKKTMTGASHKEVMEALGKKYRAEKVATSMESVALELGELKLDSDVVVIDE